MMYWVLFAAMALASFALVHGMVALLAAAVTRMARHWLNAAEPRTAVAILLVLRTLPAMLGMIMVAAVVAPAFLEHEPVAGEQHLSWKLAILSAVSLLLVAQSAW